MSTKQKRFILPEDEIPKYWYNIQADMKTKPMPPLNPKTKEALKPEDLYPIFAKELCKQELNQTDAWIEILKQCVKCTNTIAAHHWYVPTDWKKH